MADRVQLHDRLRDRGTGDGEGYDLGAREERLSEYPLAARAGEELFGSRDEGFESGLAALVSGVGAVLGPG